MSFNTINNNGSGLNTGLAIRKDWLDKLNMDIPETYEDWYNVLKVFKSEYNATMWATSSATLSYNYLSMGYAPA